MRSFFLMREIFRKAPTLFLTNVVALIFLSTVEAVAILTLAPVADIFIHSGADAYGAITQKAMAAVRSLGITPSLTIFIALFLIFNILGSALQVLGRNLTLRIRFRVVRDILVGSFDDFFRADWHFFSGAKQGVLLNTLINEVNTVGDALNATGFLLTALFQLVLYIALPFYISWQVSLISIMAAALFALPFLLAGKVTYALGDAYVRSANRMSSVLQESLGAAKVILGFGGQKKNRVMLAAAFEAQREANIRLLTMRFAIPVVYYPLGLSVVIISLFTARGMGLALSSTAVLLYSFFKVIPAVTKLTEWKNFLDGALPSYEQIMNLRRRAREMEPRSGTVRFDGLKREIRIDGASFSYADHHPVLEDVSVVIPKGKMTAFVGPSGSGKTTLIDMIIGFNRPVKGRVLIDGVPLQDLDMGSFRSRVGYVPQRATLFNMTIRENLSWAAEGISEEAIKQACRQANADEFIGRLPQGYDTTVGDRGVRLSGGQAQRVMLAMAMVRKPDILILDEATSSLDSHSERLIQEAIDMIAKETTVIVVTHRLSTIKKSDRVYLMEHGRIVEQGDFQGLASDEHSRFRKLCETQNIL